MPYYIWRAVMGGGFPSVEITQERHDAIRAAWKSVCALTAIEECWDAVVQNYIELEAEMVQVATRSMVIQRESHVEFRRDRLAFVRRVSNLLQSARAYLDQAPRHLSCFRPDGALPSFHEKRHAIYAYSFGYRVMEALRNHAQHFDVPLHSAKFGSAWTLDPATGEKGGLRYSATASIDIDRLRLNPKFKASVLAEMAELKTLDTTTLAREYIEGLGEVHADVRASVEGEIAEANLLIAGAAADCRAGYGGLDSAMTVGEWAPGTNSPSSETLVVMDYVEWLGHLQRRNGRLVNLTRRFASNEITR